MVVRYRDPTPLLDSEKSTIQGLAGAIRTKMYGLDVREAIASILEKISTDKASYVSTPKEVFENLVELRKAYPNGNTGVFITADNGHWYIYNYEKGQWQDGGQYQATEIPDNDQASLLCFPYSQNWYVDYSNQKLIIPQGSQFLVTSTRYYPLDKLRHEVNLLKPIDGINSYNYVLFNINDQQFYVVDGQHFRNLSSRFQYIYCGLIVINGNYPNGGFDTLKREDKQSVGIIINDGENNRNQVQADFDKKQLIIPHSVSKVAGLNIFTWLNSGGTKTVDFDMEGYTEGQPFTNAVLFSKNTYEINLINTETYRRSNYNDMVLLGFIGIDTQSLQLNLTAQNKRQQGEFFDWSSDPVPPTVDWDNGKLTFPANKAYFVSTPNGYVAMNQQEKIISFDKTKATHFLFADLMSNNFIILETDTQNFIKSNDQNLVYLGVLFQRTRRNMLHYLSNVPGKSISILGDSISTFRGYIPDKNRTYFPNNFLDDVNNTWWMKLVNKVPSFSLNTNNSYAGSKMSPQEDQDAGGSGVERCEALDNGTTDPDIIIIYMGANDFVRNTPLSDNATEYVDTVPDGVDTFDEAYLNALDKITKKYPNAEIYCCTLPFQNKLIQGKLFIKNDLGLNIHQYNDAIRICARSFGAHVIELDETGFNMNTVNYVTGDNHLHPNKVGMKLIAQKVKHELEISLADS